MSGVIHTEVILIGSQPAALVGAGALKSEGVNFKWFRGHSPAGGIFRGIRLGDRNWDAGMNLFEFTSLKGGESRDIRTYSPEIRYDVTRFLSFVEKYLKSKTDIHQVEMPKMYFQGILCEDLLVSNSSELFYKISESLKNIIRRELEQANPDSPFHASQKHKNPEMFLQENYDNVARINHGNFLQDYIFQPWLKLISGNGGEDIPALYHRQAWAPLFYPETLLKFLNEPGFRLQPAVFSYPSGETFGAWMEREEAGLLEYIIPDLPESICKIQGGWELMYQGEKHHCRNLAYAGDPGSLLKYAGIKSPEMKRARIGFWAVEINQHVMSDAVSVLNVCELGCKIFRVTDQTVCAGRDSEVHRLMLEFGEEIPDEAEVRSLLERCGILKEGAQFHTAGVVGPIPAIPLPVFENLKNFRNLQNKIQEIYPDLLLMGSAADMVSVSLNDQIIQGLQLPYRI